MYGKLNTIILLLIVISAVSCNAPDKRSGSGPVKKTLTKTHNGKAVISEIAPSKDNSGNGSSGYVDIYFNFIPSDPHAPDKYLCGECPDRKIRLFYDNRDSFHSTWVMKWGIKPGKEYTAVRHELLRKDNRASVSHEVFLEPGK